MNLLLLLSALLSALTGGASAMRTPAAAHAVASAAAAVQAEVRCARVSRRPQQSLASLVVSAGATMTAVFVIAPRVPVYASRRRE